MTETGKRGNKEGRISKLKKKEEIILKQRKKEGKI